MTSLFLNVAPSIIFAYALPDPTDISSGGSFPSYCGERSHGTFGFQVHSGWIQFDLCSCVQSTLAGNAIVMHYNAFFLACQNVLKQKPARVRISYQIPGIVI